MGYLSNFIVYMLAMVGIIVFALFVFKYTTGPSTKKSGKGSSLKIVDVLSLTPRKTLYIVEVSGERFLIAGDTDRTSLISKLETTKQNNQKPTINISEDFSDKSGCGIYSTQKTPYHSAIKSFAEKIK